MDGAARGIPQAATPRKSYLEVDAGNEAAQHFYLGLGYERLGLIPGYYKGKGDAVIMTRSL